MVRADGTPDYETREACERACRQLNQMYGRPECRVAEGPDGGFNISRTAGYVPTELRGERLMRTVWPVVSRVGAVVGGVLVLFFISGGWVYHGSCYGGRVTGWSFGNEAIPYLGEFVDVSRGCERVTLPHYVGQKLGVL